MKDGLAIPFGELVRLAKALRVSVTELLGESASAKQWWQVGETCFATREESISLRAPRDPEGRHPPVRESK
jgi:hypothetical protein